MARLSWVQSWVIAATFATALGGCAEGFDNPDRCVMQLAEILPPGPQLNIGDTITLRAQFYDVSADCLPPDTTAKSLRWVTASAGALGVIAIDSLTARVTALKAGWMYVRAQARFKNGSWSGYSGVGITSVSVLEPPSADTLVSRVSNQMPDSASITLEDANGIVQRTQTVAGHGSTCWVTPLSDSVRYSAFVHSPSGPTAPGGTLVSHQSLMLTHSWVVTVGDTGTAPALAAIVHAIGMNGDRGC